MTLDLTAREAQDALANATDYRGWHQAAEMLDRRQGLDEWKEDEVSDEYDWRLIRSRLRQIRQYRAENEIGKLVHHLRQGLHWNLGNTGNPALYARTRVGTKRLIEEYLNEVCAALDELCEIERPEFPYAKKLEFFNAVALSYGRSSLMLSGGATLGLFHVGVVRALFREGVLPTVLSGSSAGSVVAATVGTRGPNELDDLLDPQNAYYHFWRMLPLRQMIRRRALMDQNQLRRAIAKNIKDMTFEEAYKLSGKVINITVSPAGTNQPPRLLNYLTFPYLYIREAVLASCAVPLLFPPVMLMTRDESGERVPYLPLLRWNDGSLKSDLPMLRLRRVHNVNHFIVSQTNPHVLPFVSQREPGRRGLINSGREYIYSTLRGQARDLLNLARANVPPAFGATLEMGSNILDQDYRGNINIYPDVSLWRYINVTSNPQLHTVRRFIMEGERAAWTRVSMIRNQTQISQTLDRCIDRLERITPEGSNRVEMPRKPGLKVVRPRSE